MSQSDFFYALSPKANLSSTVDVVGTGLATSTLRFAVTGNTSTKMARVKISQVAAGNLVNGENTAIFAAAIPAALRPASDYRGVIYVQDAAFNILVCSLTVLTTGGVTVYSQGVNTVNIGRVNLDVAHAGAPVFQTIEFDYTLP